MSTMGYRRYRRVTRNYLEAISLQHISTLESTPSGIHVRAIFRVHHSVGRKKLERKGGAVAMLIADLAQGGGQAGRQERALHGLRTGKYSNAIYKPVKWVYKTKIKKSFGRKTKALHLNSCHLRAATRIMCVCKTRCRVVFTKTRNLA